MGCAGHVLLGTLGLALLKLTVGIFIVAFVALTLSYVVSHTLMLHHVLLSLAKYKRSCVLRNWVVGGAFEPD